MIKMKESNQIVKNINKITKCEIYYDSIWTDYKETRKVACKEDNDIIITSFPSFCNSEWLIAEDLGTKEKIYLLVKNGIIMDITKDHSKTYDYKQAVKTLNFILFGV